ncbi:MAG: dephospho-CoA kinase [Deinococcales bacterium]
MIKGSLGAKKTKIYGLTGNIGSGKSTVAAWLKAKGAVVIDADALAREATQDPKVLQEIADKLGPELIKDGKLDRAATAQKVFQDKAALNRLNSIIHPWVALERERLSQSYLSAETPPKLIIHDIPLLFETLDKSAGKQLNLDGIIVVYAPLETRIERVKERSQLSEVDIRARMAINCL